MKSSVKLFLDGQRVRTRRELPLRARGTARRMSRKLLRIRRTRAGVHQLLVSGAAFTPQISSYTSSGSFTETIPSGATTCLMELFGATGGGSGGTGSGCAANNGTGGGSGGRAISNAVNVAAGGGKNIAVVIGTAGAAGAAAGGVGGTGTASTFTSGTFTIVGGTMTANSGTGGNNGGGTVGGTATGGTTSNTTGNSVVARSQAGGLGLTGTNINGNPGGQGGNTGSINPGIIGFVGRGAFGYV